ncbi:hypothetical protein GEMRC1_002216 [Eukaryota sp. GEM-RC1]
MSVSLPTPTVDSEDSISEISQSPSVSSLSEQELDPYSSIQSSTQTPNSCNSLEHQYHQLSHHNSVLMNNIRELEFQVSNLTSELHKSKSTISSREEQFLRERTLLKRQLSSSSSPLPLDKSAWSFSRRPISLGSPSSWRDDRTRFQEEIATLKNQLAVFESFSMALSEDLTRIELTHNERYSQLEGFYYSEKKRWKTEMECLNLELQRSSVLNRELLLKFNTQRSLFDDHLEVEREKFKSEKRSLVAHYNSKINELADIIKKKQYHLGLTETIKL